MSTHVVKHCCERAALEYNLGLSNIERHRFFF